MHIEPCNESKKIQCESKKIQCTLNLRRFTESKNLRRFNDSICIESKKIQCALNLKRFTVTPREILCCALNLRSFNATSVVSVGSTQLTSTQCESRWTHSVGT